MFNILVDFTKAFLTRLTSKERMANIENVYTEITKSVINLPFQKHY